MQVGGGDGEVLDHLVDGDVDALDLPTLSRGGGNAG